MPPTRILVIDDDQIILDMLQIALEQAGFEVITALDGEVGLSLFHNDRPDVVVVDIQMPGIDGYQVIEHIRRAQSGGKHTPTIVLTAHDQAVMRAYAGELGVDLYLTKPIHPQKFIKHIAACVVERSIQRGMDAQFKLRQARLDAGEQSIGWKVGFGAPAALERLKLDAPLVGFLTDHTRLSSGASVSIAGWTKPALEPEIAVYMGRDLPAHTDRETARAAISALGPAIELADVHFPPDDVEAILADNIYNRHVIFGRADESRAGCLLDGLVGRVYRDGTEIAAVTDPQALTGDLVDIARHVADVLAASGETLRAGEVIITGSIVPPLWLEGNAEFRYALDPVDAVSVRVEGYND